MVEDVDENGVEVEDAVAGVEAYGVVPVVVVVHKPVI
jgi:hypothetical protein